MVGFRCLVLVMILVAGAIGSDKDPVVNYAALDKPFRMQKLNAVWDKARVKLSESKLKLLHFELKVQDKEEIALKKLKADVGDREGLRETDVRRKFNGILNGYGLGGQPQSDGDAKKSNLRLFKDKKLDRLWEKAKAVGFEDDEMMMLETEFRHYQEKVDEYAKMVEIAGRDRKHQDRRKNRVDDEEDEFEDIFTEDEEKYRHVNAVEETEMKRDLKRRFEKLHRMATKRSDQPFRESKVRRLWELAKEADFSETELADLKRELDHYETRLQKLSHLRSEVESMDERGDDFNEEDNRTDVRKKMDLKIKRQSETVKEVHKDLERMILARHTEL